MATHKLLITGCRGQLGADLVRFLGRRFDVHGVDIEDLDIRERDRVLSCVRQVKPDCVIHTAAYTDVDACENDPETARLVNATGTDNLAAACRQAGARLVYFSTDYVFDGTARSPYAETDPTAPRTEYGRSKLAGEEAVKSVLKDYAILRIAWLYGRTGKNFVRTMLRLGSEQLRRARQGEIITPLKVVDDQIGNPCWTMDVAHQTEVIIDNHLNGVFHATSEGETSWYGLARKIFDLLSMPVQVRPCTTEEYPRPAPRPKYSSLENRRLKQLGLNVMRPWDKALEDFLKQKEER